MKHPTRWITIGVAVVVVAIGVVLATQVGGDSRQEAKASQLVGAPAPGFRVRTLDGKALTRDGLAGRAVIVNFWNTWCVPCEQELPALERFAARHRDDPSVVLLGIVRDDEERAVRDYISARGIDWTVAMDPGSRAALDFGTRGQPETFAISPSGVIAGARIGPSSVSDLETLLRAAQGGAR